MLFLRVGRDERREKKDLYSKYSTFRAKAKHLLKTLAHEELGLSEAGFPNPWRAAASAMISTALGAFIPVTPFFFLNGMPALATSFVTSTLAHFVVGASKVIVTGCSWWTGGTEMTVVGLGEATITYVIGLLIAPVVG